MEHMLSSIHLENGEVQKGPKTFPKAEPRRLLGRPKK